MPRVSRYDSGRSGHRIGLRLVASGRDLGEMRPVLDRESGPTTAVLFRRDTDRPASRSRASASSCADSKRRAGCRIIAFRITSSSSSGNPGRDRSAAAPGRSRGTSGAPARPRHRGSRWDARASRPRRGWPHRVDVAADLIRRDGQQAFRGHVHRGPRPVQLICSMVAISRSRPRPKSHR